MQNRVENRVENRVGDPIFHPIFDPILQQKPPITVRFSFFVSFTCNLTGKMKLEKKNSKILRFSSVNFDRFHRKRPLFGTVLPGPALYFVDLRRARAERSCHVIT